MIITTTTNRWARRACLHCTLCLDANEVGVGHHNNTDADERTSTVKCCHILISTGIKNLRFWGKDGASKYSAAYFGKFPKVVLRFLIGNSLQLCLLEFGRSCFHDLIIVCLLLPLLLPLASSPYQAHTSCFQVWAHGDFILISPKTQGITMLGRSEADQIINDNYQI